MRELVEIALLADHGVDALAAPDRPVVLAAHRVGLAAPHLQRLAEIFRPGQRIAHVGAAERQQIVEIVRAVFREVQQLVARDEEMHLRRRFAVRRHLEFEFEPVDDALVAGRDDEVGRTQQRHRARRHRLAEPAIDLPARPLGEERPELVLRAPQHRRTRDDVFRNRMLHEQIWRDDRNAAARQRLVIEHAARAAPMVGMGVGENDGGDRPPAAVLEIQLHRRARAFDRGQRIHHDHAAVALDQRHVGDVEPAHLIDAGHHFEQSVMHVEARLPPQAGIDGRRRLGVGQEAVGLQTPDHPALRRHDPRMFQRAEKAARGLVEIAGVGERQRLQRRRMLRHHRGRGFLGCFAIRCRGHAVYSLAVLELKLEVLLHDGVLRHMAIQRSTASRAATRSDTRAGTCCSSYTDGEPNSQICFDISTLTGGNHEGNFSLRCCDRHGHIAARRRAGPRKPRAIFRAGRCTSLCPILPAASSTSSHAR